jgi:hypothetical protein
MKQPAFFATVCTTLILCLALGSVQGQIPPDTLLKRDPLKTKPKRIDVIPTEEEKTPVPVNDAQLKFDDLMRRVTGNDEAPKLLREARDLCATAKLEGCEEKLRQAASREMRRLLDLNQQSKLAPARELCDMFPSDNCGERIREADVRLRFEGLMEEANRSSSFAQKRSKLLEAKAFCEKNNLAVLNWNCTGKAEEQLQKLLNDRYSELANSIASKRTFAEKWRTIEEMEDLIADNQSYLSGKSRDWEDRKFKILDAELDYLRGRFRGTNDFRSKEGFYQDAQDLVRNYQLSEKALYDFDSGMRDASRTEIRQLLYPSRRPDFRQRLEQLEDAQAIDQKYLNRESNRNIMDVIYREREDAIAQAARQPTLRDREAHLRNYAGEFCRLLDQNEQQSCFRELEGVTARFYQDELGAMQVLARNAAQAGRDWGEINARYNQAIAFVNGSRQYFNQNILSGLQGERQQSLRQYSDNAQRSFADRLRSNNLDAAEVAYQDLREMQRVSGFQFVNTNGLLLDLHSEYLRKIGSLRNQQRFAEGFRLLGKAEAFEEQMTRGTAPRYTARDERRALSQDHFNYLQNEATKGMNNPTQAQQTIRRFASLDSAGRVYKGLVSEAQLAQANALKRSFGARALNYIDQKLLERDVDAAITYHQDLGGFINASLSDSLNRAYLAKGGTVFEQKILSQIVQLENQIASGYLDEAGRNLAAYRKDNPALARRLKVEGRNEDRFADTEFLLNLTKGQTFAAQGNLQGALDILNPLVQKGQTSKTRLKEDATRLRDQCFADLVGQKLNDIERGYDQQKRFEGLKNLQSFLNNYRLPLPKNLQDRFGILAKESCFSEREKYEEGRKQGDALLAQRKYSQAYAAYQQVYELCLASSYCDLDATSVNNWLRKYEPAKDYEKDLAEWRQLEGSTAHAAFEKQYRKLEKNFDQYNIKQFGFELKPLEQYLQDPGKFAFAAYYIEQNCLFSDQLPLISNILAANYGSKGLQAEGFKKMVYSMADRYRAEYPQSSYQEATTFFKITGKAAKPFKKVFKKGWSK